MSDYSPEVVQAVKELLDIGVALSAEKNYPQLLERILSEARRITRCDAGTLYLVDNDQLSFQIIQNDQLGLCQGGSGEPIALPPVRITSATVAGYCALSKKVVNIGDVYGAVSSELDFSGPRRYDALTGYRTISMLVVPLKDSDDVVMGVLQLLNAKDGQDEITPFPSYIEPVICAVASLAAVAIRNMRHLAEIDSMLHSFVRVISTAIDERSPYNANHTRKIARLSSAFARYLQDNAATTVTMTAEEVEQLVMSAWLHDIGKIAIPLDIMDKSSRLGDRYEFVENRFTAIREQRKVEVVKRAFKEEAQLKTAAGVAAVWEELKRIDEEMDQAAKLVATVNDAVCFVGAILQKRIARLAARTWLSPEGRREPWLTPGEVEALTVPQGTLTEKERQMMKSHVEITRKMLDQISFGGRYASVPFWACSHHEFLDGSGYPQHLEADALPVPVRILTIMDIFEALTADDRPYRRGLSPEKAFSILEEMGRQGKLDEQLVRLFKESRIGEMPFCGESADTNNKKHISCLIK